MSATPAVSVKLNLINRKPSNRLINKSVTCQNYSIRNPNGVVVKPHSTKPEAGPRCNKFRANPRLWRLGHKDYASYLSDMIYVVRFGIFFCGIVGPVLSSEPNGWKIYYFSSIKSHIFLFYALIFIF